MRSGQSQGMPPPPRPWAPGRTWDATRTLAPSELLQNGFELAYFLIPDRAPAVEILVRALEKLRVLRRRELKRLYWRDKHGQGPIRRVARSDVDKLQWLIMFESEEDEKAQERAAAPSIQSMVIRYVKHLVQISTALSSFYVNVGMTRLLRNYGTSDAQRVYEILTGRFLGPDEYRRAKAALMDEMSQRFAGFVKTTRVEHGEIRFEALGDQERWVGLVEVCLKAFTPWSTQGRCSQFVVKVSDNAAHKSAYRTADTDRNEIEMRSCHLLIEPACYAVLLEDLAFDPPDTKLDLPRFVMPEKKDKSGDNGSELHLAPGLSPEELDEIQRRLAATDARRRNLNSRLVTVVIDRVEHGRLDLAQKRPLQIEIEAGASLVEIHGEDDRGDLVLATHFIPYSGHAFELSQYSAMLGNGKLTFAVTPIANEADGPPRAILSLSYHPAFQWARLLTVWRISKISGRSIRSHALAGLTMALLAWGAASTFYGHKIRLLEEKLQQAHRNQQQLLPTTARAVISYTLTRDDQRVRGPEMDGIPEISLRLHSPAISLQLPLSRAMEGKSYSAELKTFSGDRTLLTQNLLEAARAESGSQVEIVFPSDLLRAETFYTVHLHASSATYLFTFKVVAGE